MSVGVLLPARPGAQGMCAVSTRQPGEIPAARKTCPVPARHSGALPSDADDVWRRRSDTAASTSQQPPASANSTLTDFSFGLLSERSGSRTDLAQLATKRVSVIALDLPRFPGQLSA